MNEQLKRYAEMTEKSVKEKIEFNGEEIEVELFYLSSRDVIRLQKLFSKDETIEEGIFKALDIALGWTQSGNNIEDLKKLPIALVMQLFEKVFEMNRLGEGGAISQGNLKDLQEMAKRLKKE